ncbi:lipase member M-like isoform X2 [Dreissena polymorpha]|uniref:lipase member M-like isoform X2 n=1 Tax=Dreissena polymorpha TaxID=45954 RepID=UPI002263CEEE|nr:lipase member M-like isoform X2 [Dreissena polymorpha]
MYHTAGTRPVVLLQHGLLGSAADWVVNLANQSLAFILSDTGCDVWLANSRGNTYSLRHKRLTPDDDKFWDFSWDEMASQDLPATVDYVLSASGANSLVYVGFSQGTQIAFAQLSQDRDLAAKVKLFVALAPIAYLRHMISPLRLLSPFAADIAFMLKVIGYKDFFPSDGIMKQFAAYLAKNEAAAFAMQNIMFLMGGVDYENMNTSRIPVYIAHTPAGTSVKNVMHYAQSVMSGKFTMFDYGKSKNKRKYNQTTPPEYFPANIDVPVALYTGTNDWLSVPRDVKRLKNKLKHVIKHTVVPDWEHLDFTWAMNTPKGCYNDVVKLIRKYNFP